MSKIFAWIVLAQDSVLWWWVYGNYIFPLISYKNWKNKPTFGNFREPNVSIKPVNSVYVCGGRKVAASVVPF
jgi:hypothetical protein